MQSEAEAEFERLADGELRRLVEALIALGDEIDPDLESGVLSIVFEDDSKFVVNSHRAARQIWMAAERTAWHFDFEPSAGSWRTSAGAELWSTLAEMLGRKLGHAVALR